jgi:hypothetical protein
MAIDMYRAIPRSALWVVPNGGHGPIFFGAAPQFVQTALQRISTTPSTNKLQLQHRQDDIAAAKTILGDLKSNYTQQQALGFLVPPADLSWLDTESKTLDSLLADVPNMEARLNLNGLEVQYKAMEQKRNALQAAYMKAAGTPDQTAAADALKKHLRLMYDNRIAAERAGSKSAKQQAAGLQMVMQHLN